MAIDTMEQAQNGIVGGADELSRDRTGFQWIPVSRLRSGIYQRPLNIRKVERIAREFDPALFGALLVASVGDGSFVVVDGQHRVGGVMRAHGEGATVPCVILYRMGTPEQAAAFAKINTLRSRPTAIDLFRARLIGGDPIALEIDGVLREFNLHAGDEPGQLQALAAMQAAEQIYRSYPGALRDVLAIVTTAWPDDPKRTGNAILKGMWAFLRLYGEVMDRRHLIERLRLLTPAGLLVKAVSLRDARVATTPYIGVAVEILNTYNWKLVTRRLDVFPPDEIMHRLRSGPRTGQLQTKRGRALAAEAALTEEAVG